MTDAHEDTLRAQAALDGELDAAHALAFERARRNDPSLEGAYRAAEQTSAAVKAHAPREAASEALRARVLALVEPSKTKAQPRAWALAASLAIFAFLAGAGSDRLLRPEAADGQAQALVAGFARGAVSGQPFDIASSDRHTVKPWLASRVALGVEAPDLTADGYPLAGGRIDIVAGAPAPTLVYRRREHVIALSEFAVANAPAVPKLTTLDGYHLTRWRDGERLYVVVSDIDAAELLAFADAFRRRAPGL